MIGNIKRAVHAFIVVLAAVLMLAGCGSILKSSINGDVESARKHLEKGDDVNGVDRYGWTPLMWAAYYNYYDVSKFLLEHGANVNARAEHSYRSIEAKSTPLIIASYYGHASIVRLLLRHGADKSAANAKGMTPLDYAEQYSMTEVIDLLGKAPARKTMPPADEPADEEPMMQTIILNDGSKIVGRILSQTRNTVTVRTKYTTMTIDKNRISEMKYK